jgi:hypothetical protein
VFIHKNRRGRISIQIVKKEGCSNKLIKTIVIAITQREEELLIILAKSEIEKTKGLQSLFVEHDDLVVESFVNNMSNDHLQIVGSELILGKIYEKMGLPNTGSCVAQNRKDSDNPISLP